MENIKYIKFLDELYFYKNEAYNGAAIYLKKYNKIIYIPIK